MRILGVLLVAAGVLIFVYQGITYKTREKVLDVGALEITKKKEHRVPLSPILGGIVVLSGIVVLIVGERKR